MRKTVDVGNGTQAWQIRVEFVEALNRLLRELENLRGVTELGEPLGIGPDHPEYDRQPSVQMDGILRFITPCRMSELCSVMRREVLRIVEEFVAFLLTEMEPRKTSPVIKPVRSQAQTALAAVGKVRTHGIDDVLCAGI